MPHRELLPMGICAIQVPCLLLCRTIGYPVVEIFSISSFVRNDLWKIGLKYCAMKLIRSF